MPDTDDAIEVLDGPLSLYRTAIALLEEALDLEEDASRAVLPRLRNALLRRRSHSRNRRGTTFCSKPMDRRGRPRRPRPGPAP